MAHYDLRGHFLRQTRAINEANFLDFDGVWLSILGTILAVGGRDIGVRRTFEVSGGAGGEHASKSGWCSLNLRPWRLRSARVS